MWSWHVSADFPLGRRVLVRLFPTNTWPHGSEHPPNLTSDDQLGKITWQTQNKLSWPIDGPTQTASSRWSNSCSFVANRFISPNDRVAPRLGSQSGQETIGRRPLSHHHDVPRQSHQSYNVAKATSILLHRSLFHHFSHLVRRCYSFHVAPEPEPRFWQSRRQSLLFRRQTREASNTIDSLDAIIPPQPSQNACSNDELGNLQ